MVSPFVGDRKTLAGDTATKHTITNLSVRSRFLSEQMELIGLVANLFDVDYSDPGSEEHIQDLLAQNGRDVRLKLRYRF